MTRETKIGLLVGLAFIIVIGILLSDHMTSTTAPLVADMTETYPTVRKGATVPGQGEVTKPRIDTRGSSEPDVPVIIESRPERSGVQVEIRPPAADRGAVEPHVVDRGSLGGSLGQDPSPIFTPPITSQTPRPEGSHGGFRVPEGLEDHIETPNTNRGPEIVVIPEIPTTPETLAVKAYKVQDGDTISKIARKMLGSDSKANREAIAKANPGMKDPHKIIAGQSINVPANPPAPAQQASNEPKANTTTGQVESQVTPPAAPVVVAQEEKIYTTKPDDTLWRIAIEQCGGPGMVKQLKELNKDVLKGGDRIKPNMKLKLPPKQQMASAT